MSMQSNVEGRVRHTRLPTSKSLLPVFECIVNSIHATNGISNGRISIEVLRDQRQKELLEDRTELPIIGFSIKDNGVGFNDENYESFTFADSDFKRNLGAKGVGRFLWLKAFEYIEINSVYIADGKQYRRSFVFKASKQGIENHSLTALENGDGATGTEVRLMNLAEIYQRTCPKKAETIAEKIVTHLLIYFYRDKIPTTVVFDTDTPSLSLNSIYKEQIASNIESSTFNINSHKFDVSFMKQKMVSLNSHDVMFCADEREVITENLNKYVSGLPNRFEEASGEPYVLWIYITGKYLDINANPERTEILFSPDNQASLDDLVSKGELAAAVTNSVKAKYAPIFAKVESEHKVRLTTFVTDKAPYYRPLLNERYKHIVEKIPVGATDDEIEIYLHKGLRDVEIELKFTAKEIATSLPKTADEMELLREKYEKFLNEENLIGMTTLAKYVIHRKVIIDLFEKAIQLGPEGDFVLEKVLHGLVCPLTSDSNDMDWLQRQNLWLIDERLTHHLHLQSDKTLKSNPLIKIASTKEPDILVFEHGPHAFTNITNHPGSAVIIEFKRPGNDRQTKDPLDQITGYIDKINSGKIRDTKGELIKINNIPYTAYIICDLSSDVVQSAKKYGLKESVDKKSFYGYLNNWNCYCEILSFRTVLDDAKKKNRILFEKLNLPTS